MKKLSKKEILSFQTEIHSFWKKHKRILPWRKTKNPYYIWVSEVMLQQTQVERVIPKYKAFTQRFRMIEDLAETPLKEVLQLWQGLGYNRRAQNLHKGAKYVVQNHKGKLPKTIQELESIPSIGPYTAGAISNFAYNKKAVCIETNIRTVYLYSFFSHKKDISDKQLFPLIEQTFDSKHPREWVSALMDYGSFLKKSGIQNNTQSKEYTKQSSFKGSDREIRGEIIRTLLRKNQTENDIQKIFYNKRNTQVLQQLNALSAEKLIVYKQKKYSIA